ncbi:hypothetical protein GZ998_02500 [Actinomyces sp. 594]|uniref:hypothetical protein n=1 Tax=Actinomyces sp. 594 TaxID=2057793 RepID=UPI001C5811D0|nr:hypothetical protein [Actinomyces sp. 594]MBW3068389.1 hypothetical protein [Actinomyces sp. 594]
MSALLLACAPLVACSQDSGGASGVPTYDPAAAASARASESAAAAQASASAAASAEAAGVVTAESLSTDRYQVTSIPEDLDELQTEALKAFINYDQATWDVWFTGAGIEDTESLLTPEEYKNFVNNFNAAQDETTDGMVRVAVFSVSISSIYASEPKAEVLICDDQSRVVSYDSDGNDISDLKTQQGRYKKAITMIYRDGAWIKSGGEALSANECVV